MDTISTENLSQIISNANTFAIITHKRPDGDAISSALAIFWYLIDIGKNKNNIDVIIPEFNNDFSFIPGIEHLKKINSKKQYDLVTVVDCATLHLLKGCNILKHAKQTICFDHHEKTSINTTYSFIDISAPSCTCIIYKSLNCTSKDFLNCIAIGLISDTVNLTLNVTKLGLSIIDELKDFGIDINYLLSKLMYQNNRTIQLVEIAKERGYFIKAKNKSVFCTYLLQKDLLNSEKTLTQLNHKAIIFELQKLLNYNSLILLIENNKGEFRGSLRTHDDNINLNKICLKLVSEGKIIKGGGHSYSAGFTAKGEHDEIIKLFAYEILS